MIFVLILGRARSLQSGVEEYWCLYLILLKNLVEFGFWVSHFVLQSCDFSYVLGKERSLPSGVEEYWGLYLILLKILAEFWVLGFTFCVTKLWFFFVSRKRHEFYQVGRRNIEICIWFSWRIWLSFEFWGLHFTSPKLWFWEKTWVYEVVGGILRFLFDFVEDFGFWGCHFTSPSCDFFFHFGKSQSSLVIHVYLYLGQLGLFFTP